MKFALALFTWVCVVYAVSCLLGKEFGVLATWLWIIPSGTGGILIGLAARKL